MKNFFKSLRKRSHKEDSSKDDNYSSKIPSHRLTSLDAFRGLTIFGMLLVNNMALDTETPTQLKHALWNQGVTFADMVYPWFLLIVGMAIPYAVSSFKKKNQPFWRYDLKILSRTFWLLFLGFLLDSSIAHQPVFGLGVLQLIGLAYLLAAFLYELPWERRIILAVIFLLAHWALIRFFSVPGVGPGVFTESQNVVKHLNEQYFQSYHLRGILSVIPTGALVMIGSVLGDLIRLDSIKPLVRSGIFLGIGIVLAVLGWLWNLDLPFNKPVWTPSYVLFAAGIGSIVFILLYLVLDILPLKFLGFPLVVFGSNAILAYVMPILVKVHILLEWTLPASGGVHIPLQQFFLKFLIVRFGRIEGGWIYTFTYIGFWWIILLFLHRRKVFLRV